MYSLALHRKCVQTSDLPEGMKSTENSKYAGKYKYSSRLTVFVLQYLKDIILLFSGKLHLCALFPLPESEIFVWSTAAAWKGRILKQIQNSPCAFLFSQEHSLHCLLSSA